MENKEFAKQIIEKYKFVLDVKIYKTQAKLIFILGGEKWFTSKEEIIDYCEKCKNVFIKYAVEVWGYELDEE